MGIWNWAKVFEPYRDSNPDLLDTFQVDYHCATGTFNWYPLISSEYLASVRGLSSTMVVHLDGSQEFRVRVSVGSENFCSISNSLVSGVLIRAPKFPKMRVMYRVFQKKHHLVIFWRKFSKKIFSPGVFVCEKSNSRIENSWKRLPGHEIYDFRVFFQLFSVGIPTWKYENLIFHGLGGVSKGFRCAQSISRIKIPLMSHFRKKIFLENFRITYDSMPGQR